MVGGEGEREGGEGGKQQQGSSGGSVSPHTPSNQPRSHACSSSSSTTPPSFAPSKSSSPGGKSLALMQARLLGMNNKSQQQHQSADSTGAIGSGKPEGQSNNFAITSSQTSSNGAQQLVEQRNSSDGDLGRDGSSAAAAVDVDDNNEVSANQSAAAQTEVTVNKPEIASPMLRFGGKSSAQLMAQQAKMMRESNASSSPPDDRTMNKLDDAQLPPTMQPAPEAGPGNKKQPKNTDGGGKQKGEDEKNAASRPVQRAGGKSASQLMAFQAKMMAQQAKMKQQQQQKDEQQMEHLSHEDRSPVQGQSPQRQPSSIVETPMPSSPGRGGKQASQLAAYQAKVLAQQRASQVQQQPQQELQQQQGLPELHRQKGQPEISRDGQFRSLDSMQQQQKQQQQQQQQQLTATPAMSSSDHQRQRLMAEARAAAGFSPQQHFQVPQTSSARASHVGAGAIPIQQLPPQQMKVQQPQNQLQGMDSPVSHSTSIGSQLAHSVAVQQEQQDQRLHQQQECPGSTAAARIEAAHAAARAAVQAKSKAPQQRSSHAQQMQQQQRNLGCTTTPNAVLRQAQQQTSVSTMMPPTLHTQFPPTPIPTATESHPSGPTLAPICGTRLSDLLHSIDPTATLDPEASECMLRLADDFLEKVTSQACRLANHRGSDMMDVQDLSLALGKNWGIVVPGMMMPPHLQVSGVMGGGSNDGVNAIARVASSGPARASFPSRQGIYHQSGSKRHGVTSSSTLERTGGVSVKLTTELMSAKKEGLQVGEGSGQTPVATSAAHAVAGR